MENNTTQNQSISIIPGENIRSDSVKLRSLMFALFFLLIATSGFAQGGAARENAVTGEIGVAVNLTTVDDFDSNLAYAQIVAVEAIQEPAGSWRFSVAVRHNDEGWNHYADLWEVVDPESSLIYGQRILAHPHENEQPFTRSQSAITIPQEVTTVLVRARCTDHGFRGRAVLVDLSVEKGEGFTVIR